MKGCQNRFSRLRKLAIEKRLQSTAKSNNDNINKNNSDTSDEHYEKPEGDTLKRRGQAMVDEVDAPGETRETANAKRVKKLKEVNKGFKP